jgi:hypothetical protein
MMMMMMISDSVRYHSNVVSDSTVLVKLNISYIVTGFLSLIFVTYIRNSVM